jgi:hypothetical protein
MMEESTPILRSDASPPQDTSPSPSNENEHRKLFDLMASKKWSEAIDLVDNKNGQRTPQDIQNQLFYQNDKGYTALKVASAPWRDISGLHRQRHQKGSRSRLPVRSQNHKKKYSTQLQCF